MLEKYIEIIQPYIHNLFQIVSKTMNITIGMEKM